MYKRIKHDIQIFHYCPEIRGFLFRMWIAKLTSYLSLAILSPFMLIGLIAIGIVSIMDRIGQLALFPAHKATQWLFRYQQNQIRGSHDVMSVEEIQARIGNAKGTILPKTGDENGE